MNILVINAGSSSLKYQLINMETEDVLAKGLCERIGLDGIVTHKPLVGSAKAYSQDYALPNHAVAITAVLDLLTSKDYGVISSTSEIQAVGHRVVHGGESFASSVLINDEVIDAVKECIPLAPLHNPANLDGIDACRKIMGDIPQVAVFDTAFHQTMPKHAYTYAIPYEYYEKYKVRRYGFHGTSHFYVSRKASEILEKPVEELKLITCHLGNGSSISAIDGGRSIDTSMGFTPLAGMPMGTRSGDIDAGILQYIMDVEGVGINDMLDVLNKKSGVQGISGVSSDFRDLYKAGENEGAERAFLALKVFAYNAAKIIGSYAAAMNGVDAIVFTAGIGENGDADRKNICSYLGYLGCEFDDDANQIRGSTFISKPDSKVKLMVIPTNEELVIARDTAAIVRGI